MPNLELQILVFLDSQRIKGSSLNTCKAYAVDLGHLVEFLRMQDIGEKWGQVTPRLLERFVDWLSLVRHYRISTIARKLAAVRSFFAFLENTGVLSENLAETLGGQKVRRGPASVLTPGEVEKLLARPIEADPILLRNQAILMCCALGLRSSEVTGLDVGDIDFDRWRVWCKYREESIRINLGVVMSTLKAYAQIRPQLAQNVEEQPFFVGTKGYRGGRGARLTRQWIWQAVQEYVLRAGIIEKVTPDMIRESVGRYAFDMGVPLAQVQQSMGHRSINTTKTMVGV